MSTKAVRFTVYREPELHRALHVKAAHRHRSMSDLVNEALRQSLRQDQEDLAAVRSCAREKSLGYEEFLAKLKPDCTI